MASAVHGRSFLAHPTRKPWCSATPATVFLAFLAAVSIAWYVGTLHLLFSCDSEEVGLGGLPSAGRKSPARRAASSVLDAPPGTGTPAVREIAGALLDLLKEEAATGGDDPKFQQLAASLTEALTAAAAAMNADAPAAAEAEPAPPSSPPRTGAPVDGEEPYPEFTQQTCYLQADESETCVYDNVLCFDGKSPIVVVDKPVRDPERICDYTHSCQDFRYYEPSALEISGCAYSYTFDRPYNMSAPRRPASDFPLPLGRRRWGPQNRNGLLYFKEMSPEEIWGAELKSSAYKLPPGSPGRAEALRRDLGGKRGRMMVSPSGSYAAPIERDGPYDSPTVPGFRIAYTTRVGEKSIHWSEGHIWLAGIDGQWWFNPYHWWTKMGALYDAMRSNATSEFGAHPHDGYLQWVQPGDMGSTKSISMGKPTLNRAKFRVGPQWDLPPMDNIIFTGDGAIVLKNRDALTSWFRSTMELATQPHSLHFFNDMLGTLNNDNIVCTTRGGMPGAKNKLFTARADGWMFRQYAYQYTGLAAAGVRSHPRYPPRKITVIDRKGMNGRGVYNKEALLEAIKATGCPYQIVPNMASLTFRDQVALMAGTGILIAPHGAHLANAMFMPAHSVLIELFPYLLKKNTYRGLATMMDLHYIPVYSWELLPLNATQFYGVELMAERYYWDNCVKTNISSYDALVVHACNAMSKNYPIIVPFPSFSQVLRDAIDSIGAFSRQNPEWDKVADKEGIPVPTPPPPTEDKHGA